MHRLLPHLPTPGALRPFFITLTLGLAVSGCAPWAAQTAAPATPTARDAQAASPVPAQWSVALAASGPQADADWWRGFDDARLTALVDAALAHNLELRAAAINLERARAQRALTAAAGEPGLGLGARAGRNRSGGRSASSLGLALDASWEADLFGANAAALAAADADLQATASTLQATRLAIAAETALAYLQWQGARAQHAGSTRSLQSQQQTLALVLQRQQSGLASDLEVEQARSAVLQLQARLDALQLAQTQALHGLALLLGQAPGAPTGVLAQLDPTGTPRILQAPRLPALAQPAELLQRRYDLQAAGLRIQAQLATLAQREAERRPQLRLSGNLALQAASWSALGGSGALLAGLAAAIDWPLLDGGAGAARVQAQQAALATARNDWQAAVLGAVRDVEDALAALTTAGARAATLQDAARSADEARRLARIGYEGGVADFLSLLDAERSALSAADALLSARVDLAASHVRLYKALGGHWNPDPDARSTRP